MNESNPFLTFESEIDYNPANDTMESVITPHYLPGLHPIFSFTKSKLGSLSFSQNDENSLQIRISNVKTDGDRRIRFAQRNRDSGRSINGDDNNKTPQESSQDKSKTYNKEEILALFRRIQSSISAESNASKGRTKNGSSAESVLQVLRQSTNQVKGKTSNREASTVSSEWKKEEIVDFKSTDAKMSQIVDFKSTDAKMSRPPSNFVKRSPIPSEKVEEEVKSEGLETMKLVALKELAKSRGIKGYSKLKKGELIELLRSV